MIGPRIEFIMTLVARTALHVGSGDFMRDTAEPTKDEDEKRPEVAAVMRDHAGNPYIPGSTLKGCLRQRLPEATKLFGETIRENDTVRFRAGSAIFSDAFAVDGAVTEQSTRVAIDDETGVARKARLFTREIVPPGTRFSLTLVCPAKLDDDLRRDMARLVGLLLSEQGVALGKGTRQAMGRVSADPRSFLAKLVAPGRKITPDVTADWKASIDEVGAAAFDRRRVALRLTSQAPFLISDPANAPAKGDKTTPQIVGLQDADGAPVLTGATLMGALRAKSAWIETMMCPTVRDDKDAVLLDVSDAPELTCTQRLFGVTGWRGQLSAERIELQNNPPRQRVTSVKIDRFSAAPIDNALYTVEAWLAPEYRVDLRFDPRRSKTADDDWAFFQDIVLKDLTDDIWGGLDLGLGKTRGFGAFDVEVEDV